MSTQPCRPLTVYEKASFGSGAAIIATALLHPLDYVKKRMQLNFGPRKPTIEVARRIWRTEGVIRFSCGLSAAMLRQVTYTVPRLLVYHNLFKIYKSYSPDETKPLHVTMIGVIAGLTGAFLGTPSEVALIRMISQSVKWYLEDKKSPLMALPYPVAMQPNFRPYKNLRHTIFRILREEGHRGLWRGGLLTMTRSIPMSITNIGINAKELVSKLVDQFLGQPYPTEPANSYKDNIFENVLTKTVHEYIHKHDDAKHIFGHVCNTIEVDVITAVLSTFLNCFVSLPLDKVKTLYQARSGQDTNNEGAKEQKEPETTGHDRFYQERSRSSYRKKKRKACRRAQSAAELNPESISMANKRNAFSIRSVSTDREESEEENSEKAPLVAQKIDSLAKMLFNKSIIGTGSGKSSPSDPPASPKLLEKSMEHSAAVAICMEYLSLTSRYVLISQINAIGSRQNKYWFAIHDNTIKTDRLLTLMPLTSKCPIEPNERTQSLLVELFRALHHPYIYPVLDLEIFCGHALSIMPFNARGSLKDLIFKSAWNEDYSRKYGSIGIGLPPGQVARFGRQMLEGLLFLKDKGFPPFRHLHSGNVMVQNGVARICGLENTLIGALPRCPIALTAPIEFAEVLSLGHVLFEMCAGADFDLSLLPDLSGTYPQVVEIIHLIFGPRTPTLHELLLYDLFRKIDLREMKGPCLPNFSQRLSRSCLSLLGEVHRRTPGVARDSAQRRPPLTPPSHRRHFPKEQDTTEIWQW